MFVSVVPLLQVAFLSLFLAPERATVSNFAVAIGTVRALRQVIKLTVPLNLNASLVFPTALALLFLHRKNPGKYVLMTVILISLHESCLEVVKCLIKVTYTFSLMKNYFYTGLAKHV